MKNILFYIYPEKKFAKDYVLMSQVQIDNSLDYWKPEDILVVTNFPWEYHGVKSLVVGEELYAQVQSHGTSLSNKPIVIKYLIKHRLVDDLNWFHDWDIWQLAPLDLPPLDRDIGFVDYSYFLPLRGKSRIQLGSIFFKPFARDVFNWIEDGINKYKQNEEETLNLLVNQNFNNIQDRFTKLNVTYNIGMINLRTAIERADKPLRIAHFPPYRPKYLHKANKILPPKLLAMLNDKFTQPEAINDLQEPRFEDRVWKPFMEKYNCQKIAEIGVAEGENFKRMIEHNPEIAVAVDAWINDGVVSRDDLGYPQEKLNQMHDEFKTQMADKSFVQIYREYSTYAAKHFPDGYFDLIYIDADHTYRAVLGDIEDWYPKLRRGGFLIGDDYCHSVTQTGVKFGVIEAVNQFANANNLNVYELPSYGWALIKV